MDRQLLDLLVCPVTRQPLELLEQKSLALLNDAIGQGGVVRGDGSARAAPLQQALATRDRARVYPIDDGIPVLLAEEAIAADKVDGFAAP
ncbi:MAG: Trm112 family protein [Pseudomonadota bacterium]|nr:Trm112 family protein [Pseudomonadota bacterium]